jgi:antirestriction protein ArdC
MVKNKDAAYDVVADIILEALEGGTVPWRKPWNLSPGQRPQNAISKRPYSGVNALILGLAPYEDPRWISYKKAIELGGHVREGENRANGRGGIPIVWWRSSDRPCDPAHPGEICNNCDPKHPGIRRWYSLGYHLVWNIEQCEGLDFPEIDKPAEAFDPIEAAEAIVKGVPNPPSIAHDGGDQAYYRPLRDAIHLPLRSAFDGPGEYYSTLFHELGHSTGHESRLNRHGLETGIAAFGSATYSREELAAEFAAAFVCNEAGISNTLDNSAAYIAGWAKAIKKDKRLVVAAASQGQRAADYILDRS